MTPDSRFLMPKTPSAEHALERQWYVRVEGATYGPYDDQTLWGFVQESRVTAHSEVSMRPDRGFRPARDWLEIAHWFHAPAMNRPEPQYERPAPQIYQEPAYEPVQSAMPTQEWDEPAEAAPSTNLLLIVANIRSGRLSLFTQTLMTLGQTRPLTASTWLVESEIDPDNAKSVLSPALATSDSLLILDASESVFASLNLGIEDDGGVTPGGPSMSGRLFGG